MTRMTKCAAVLAAGLALGLLSAKAAMSDDGPADRPAQGDNVRDTVKAPPGPPDDEDIDRPPPPPDREGRPGPRREGRAGPDDRRPPGPPQGPGFDHPPPDREGRPGPSREGRPGPDDRRSPGPPQGPGFDGPPPGPPRWPYPDWTSMEKKDPDMFKVVKQEMDLERQTRDLAGDYRQAAPAKRDEIKKQVEKLVGQQFEVRQQRRQLELKRFDEELQRLRDAIERRSKARKQIVEKRVAELLGQEEDTGF
jgi:hypothetical protein